MEAEGPLAESGSVSELLARWQAADQQTLEALLPVVYEELRRLAHRYLQRQRPGHSTKHRIGSRGVSPPPKAEELAFRESQPVLCVGSVDHEANSGRFCACPRRREASRRVPSDA